MKTIKNICNYMTFSTIILAVAAVTWLPGSARAEDMKPMKGGEHLMMLNQVKTFEEAAALKTDDTMAMVCSKCKTVWITRVKQGVKGAQLLTANGQTTALIGTHMCAGCNSTLTIVGVQKGAHAELKHTCAMCGDNSAFCCATTPDAKPTKGMETDK